MTILQSGYGVKAQPTAIGLTPPEGARVFPGSFLFTTANALTTQSFTANLEDLGISMFQGLFLDNSQSGASTSVTVVVPDFGQVIAIPPQSQAFVPVLSVGARGMTVSFNAVCSASPAANYNFSWQILNFPTQLSIWNTLSAASGFSFDAQGNLKVTGAGTGGTSSNFAAAFPAAGTAAGYRVVTGPQAYTAGNMQSPNIGVTGDLWVDIKSPLDGGGNVQVDVNTPLPAGTNLIGKVDCLGNAGATIDALPGAASTNAVTIQGITGMKAISIAGNAGAAVDALPGAASTNALTVQGIATGVPIPVSEAQVVPANSAASRWLNPLKAAVQLKATKGVLKGMDIANLDTTINYLQVFFLPLVSVTLGTTAPDLVYQIPGSGYMGPSLPVNGAGGNAFSGNQSGVTIAATTTPTGATLPTNGLAVNAYWE